MDFGYAYVERLTLHVPVRPDELFARGVDLQVSCVEQSDFF